MYRLFDDIQLESVARDGKTLRLGILGVKLEGS